ncbi:MAG: histidine kinase [Saprospiraceae bacterium]
MLTTIFQRGPWPDLLLWSAYTLLVHAAFAPDPLDGSNMGISLAFLAGELAAAYLHLGYGLVPRLHKRRSLAAYLLVLLGSRLAGVILAWVGLVLIGLLLPDLLPTLDLPNFLAIWLPRVGWSIITLVAISSGLYLFAHRRRQAERERQLEVARTQAELAYLRGQLNPHFLFNALNNIYVLISRDPARARESLTGFSDLLRYQLYRSEQELVPLSEEVEQIEKFSALSLLRMEEDFQFVLEAPRSDPRPIPPMLLLPLVENAFKYSPPQGGYVRARLELSTGETRFEITNSVLPQSPADRADGTGGIGLTNIHRRLELLYPDRYTLTTQAAANPDRFTVRLTIPAP